MAAWRSYMAARSLLERYLVANVWQWKLLKRSKDQEEEEEANKLFRVTS